MHVVARATTYLLAFSVLNAGAAFADDPTHGLQVSLRTGLETSSSIKRDGEWDAGGLLAAVDVHGFSDRFLLGGGLAASGGPFGPGTVLGAVHAGVHTLTDSMHASAVGGIGYAQISYICSECETVSLPFTDVTGAIAYAFTHVEVGVWANARVDLDRDRITSSLYTYEIGGFTVGGGVTVAFLSRP